MKMTRPRLQMMVIATKTTYRSMYVGEKEDRVTWSNGLHVTLYVYVHQSSLSVEDALLTDQVSLQ